MLKNKKIFFILLISIALLLVLNSNCFATTGNEEIDNLIKNNFYYIGLYVHSNFGDFNDYVVFNTGGNASNLIILNPNNGYFDRASGGYVHTNYSLIFLDITNVKFNSGTDISKYLYLDRWNGASDDPDFFGPGTFDNYIVYNTCSSALDKCSDNFGDLNSFFCKTRLAQVVKQAGMEKTLQEVIQLLPMILVVVVSFLGLRKALQVLSRILHQS